MQVSENLKGKEGKTNFYARASEVKKALFLKRPTIVLLYKEALFNTNQLDSSLPSSNVSLLQEFEDDFPEEIPNGLPPIQRIKHQIDFVLGATIPNRPAYRTNPEETKELQKQVGELMEKGYVRDSLCGDPRARSDPVGESEPKPRGRSVLFLFIFRVIKFLFSKVSRPETPT